MRLSAAGWIAPDGRRGSVILAVSAEHLADLAAALAEGREREAADVLAAMRAEFDARIAAALSRCGAPLVPPAAARTPAPPNVHRKRVQGRAAPVPVVPTQFPNRRSGMRPASTTLFAALLAATTALTTPPLALADAEWLVVDLVNEPTTLDPHLQWNPDSYYVYYNIFDNLLTRDDQGAIVTQIATEWDQISGTKTVLTIRDDVRFHDGSPLTAEDVILSVQRITDLEFGSPQLSQLEAIIAAEVLEDGRVKLNLTAACPGQHRPPGKACQPAGPKASTPPCSA